VLFVLFVVVAIVEVQVDVAFVVALLLHCCLIDLSFLVEWKD
jgi:hypothetical protein